MSKAIAIAPTGALSVITNLEDLPAAVAHVRAVSEAETVATKSLGEGLVGVSSSTSDPVNPYAHAVYDALTGGFNDPVFGTVIFADLDGYVTPDAESKIRKALKSVSEWEIHRRTRASEKFIAKKAGAPAPAETV